MVLCWYVFVCLLHEAPVHTTTLWGILTFQWHLVHFEGHFWNHSLVSESFGKIKKNFWNYKRVSEMIFSETKSPVSESILHAGVTQLVTTYICTLFSSFYQDSQGTLKLCKKSEIGIKVLAEQLWSLVLHQGGRKHGHIRPSLFEIILSCFGTVYLVQRWFWCVLIWKQVSWFWLNNEFIFEHPNSLFYQNNSFPPFFDQ
jgi:hypothetical protein